MPWTYQQSSGNLFRPDGVRATVGWSGHGQWKNDPDAQGEKNKGPLPRGTYTILPPEKSKAVGEYAMALLPDPANDMLGRGSFYMHGASRDPAHYGQESDGCIVIDRPHREDVWGSHDHVLMVIA